jgi:tRNA (cmo5U34)-methyltransferase
VAQFHDQAERYLARMRAGVPSYDRLQEELARASDGLAVRAVLDLGTGSGETARRVLAHHPGARLVGVDASAAMLAIARERLDGADGALHVGRLEDALPPGPFDLVVTALAVHHLDSAAKRDLFGRVRDALAPGGRFVMADVVEPAQPPAHPTPLDRSVDRPERVDDLVRWLRDSGLDAAVAWSEGDLAVVRGDRVAGGSRG